MYLTNYKILHKHKKQQKKWGGRNNKGRIVIRHRGGGSKTFYRIINWNKSISKGLIIGLIPNIKNRQTLLQILDINSKKIFYHLSPLKISPLDNITENLEKIQEGFIQLRYKIDDLEIGDFINTIQTSNDHLPQYIKAPGTVGQLIQKHTSKLNYSLIQLPSGEQKYIHKKATITKGRLNNMSWKYETLKKAGRSRWLGYRSKVRGVAMNPIDHPHGGGEGKTSGGRPSVTPYGRLTKNVPTRKKRSKTDWTIVKKKK